MEYKELKTKSEKELAVMLVEAQEKCRELKFKVNANQLKNLRELREAKKKIAQILFLLNQAKKSAK
ncbi:MAG: 50S ribosomal protein L29 [Candidatus Buchananbacteria bacterium]